MEKQFKQVYIEGPRGGFWADYVGEKVLKEKILEALSDGVIKNEANVVFTSMSGRQTEKYLIWNQKRNSIKFVKEKPGETVEYKTVEGDMIFQMLKFLYEKINEPVSKIGDNIYQIAVKDIEAKAFKEKLCKNHCLKKSDVSIVKAHYDQWYHECQGLSMSSGVTYETGWYSYVQIKNLTSLKVRV